MFLTLAIVADGAPCSLCPRMREVLVAFHDRPYTGLGLMRKETLLAYLVLINSTFALAFISR